MSVQKKLGLALLLTVLAVLAAAHYALTFRGPIIGDAWLWISLALMPATVAMTSCFLRHAEAIAHAQGSS